MQEFAISLYFEDQFWEIFPAQNSPLPIPVANTMAIVVKETESGLDWTFQRHLCLCILPASVAETQPVKEWGGISRRLCLHFCFGPK